MDDDDKKPMPGAPASGAPASDDGEETDTASAM